MEALIKRLFINWTTTLPATLALICESAAFAEMLPDVYEKYLHAGCLFLLTIGVFAAKSQGVSNSPKPVAAAPVTAEDQAKPNPSVTAALGLIIVFGLSGCAGMNPFAQEAKSRLEAIVDIAAAGTYKMQYTVSKDGRIISSRTIIYVCTPVEGTLPDCKKSE